MRDPKRLDFTYSDLKRLHQTYFPDMRTGQFFTNVFRYMDVALQRDPFFPEEDELLKYFRDYCKEVE